MATSDQTQQKLDTIPFYPDHVKTEAIVAAGIIGVLFIIGVVGQFFPVGLDAPADPMVTPAHTKPEWYFLFLYQILKLVPKTLGVLIPIVGLLVIMIWPFLDRGRGDPVQARRLRIIVTVIVMAAIIALTIWGEVS
jgi:quinol-cytochrome oxidoreductase complex cytochrome b subunit